MTRPVIAWHDLAPRPGGGRGPEHLQLHQQEGGTEVVAGGLEGLGCRGREVQGYRGIPKAMEFMRDWCLVNRDRRFTGTVHSPN